jgi:hypothetical protein
MPNTITPICGDGNDVIIVHYGNVRYCPRCWAGIIATSIFHRKNKHISTFDQEKHAAAQCSSFKKAKHSLFLWEIAQQTWFEVRNVRLEL